MFPFSHHDPVERDAAGNPVALNPPEPVPVAAAVQLAQAAADPSAAGAAPGQSPPSDPAPPATVTVGYDESPHDLAARLGHPGQWYQLIAAQAPSWWAAHLGHLTVPPATEDEGVRAILGRWLPGLELTVPEGWDAPEPEPEPSAPMPTEQVAPAEPKPAFWAAR